MPTKPLEYPSLRVILEHMEANLRFQLSLQIPSIRKMEKAVPLKINELDYHVVKDLINDTEYQLAVYRDYHLGDCPDFVQRINPFGTVKYDIDHLGFRDDSTQFIETPGDVIIFDDRVLESITQQTNNQEQGKRNVNRFIETHEAAIQRMEREKADLEIIEATDVIRSQIRELQIVIDCHRTNLLPYFHLRDNTVPTYNTWIQLTMKSKSKETIIKTERVKYTKKLCEAQKYLSDRLFKGRNHFIRVGQLGISLYVYTIIRFPENLKMKIRKLDVACSQLLHNEKLMGLIDNSSYPLQYVCIWRINGEWDLPIVRTASKIHLGEGENGEPQFDRIMNLPNKNVSCGPFSADPHVLLVQKWLDSNREVGTEYTFAGMSFDVAERFLKIVIERIEGAIGGERSVTIPMRNNTEFRISHVDCPNPDHEPLVTVKMEIC